MDPVRFGRAIRALRQRRGWRQEDLATAAAASQPVISRIELGQLRGIPYQTLESVSSTVGARLELQLQWQGEGLDRLLDRAHASVVEQLVRLLKARGWETQTEVSFSIYGERGSVDVLARHVPSRQLLVIEVKTAIGDIQATLSALDRKVRNAPSIARSRGWTPSTASRLLVVTESATTRRRVAEHAATFASVLPSRGRVVRRWLSQPGPAGLAGVWFLSPTRPTGRKQRIRPARAA